jgi:hypothetical protein
MAERIDWLILLHTENNLAADAADPGKRIVQLSSTSPYFLFRPSFGIRYDRP